MRGRKNKVLILIIICFVFFILAGCLYLSELAKKSGNNFIASSSPKKISSSTVPVATNIASSSSEKENVNFSSLNEKISAPADIYYPVVKVVDGDTVDIAVNGKTERLRLIGINTPETVDPNKPVECFGPQASANAHKLLDGAEVKIAPDPSQDDKDIYGRFLRYVWRSDGLFYNLEAIKDGFAFEYTFKNPYQYQKEFQAAQKSAQTNQLGLWSACEKNSTLTAQISTGSSTNSCAIKGNISTGGVKIYELPNCPYYKKTVIDENKGEKWFCTEGEALTAGWRKAGNCP
jgi:micrococcal nuclease